jgi:hypothetical protein
MAGIAPAVPVPEDGIATPGMVTGFVVDAASAFTAASRAFPFGSARRIGIGIVTGITTGATADKRKKSGKHPALFYGQRLR